MKKRYLAISAALSVAWLLLMSCGIMGTKDPQLKLNPYAKNLAFYGNVIDKATRQPPLYPIAIQLFPEDPGNHVVVDSCLFFIQDKGLDPAYDYSLRIGAQYYNSVEIPLKYIRGKAQQFKDVELENIEPKIQGPFKIKPFVEFDPGSGVLEKPGWQISSFLIEWKSVDQPFTFEDVEQYVKDNQPAGLPAISSTEIRQAVDSWVKDGLIQTYGKSSYKLK